MKQLKRKLRQCFAGFLALCLTMTSFNMVSWADVEKAFDSGNAIFMISGEELRNSAQAAIDAGETFQVDDLGLGDEDQSLKREYEKLFGKGRVYEFSPEYYLDEEASADGAELRMFIRTADIEGEYLLTGDEEVIFLYVNESDEKITFRSNIDGYLTQKVSVKAFSEGTTAIPNVPEVQPELPVPDEGVVNPEETEAEEESKAVDETEDAEEVESTEETGSTEETEENGNVEESSEAEEGAEDGETEDGSGTESGSDETADDEGQADSEGSSDDVDTGSEDSDTGSSDNGGSEAEETDSGASHEGSGAQASISRHMLSVLTSSDVTALEEGTPSEAEPEVEDEPVVDEGEGSAVLGNTKGKTYGAVLLDESYYAKAYVTTLNQLNVDTTAEGYRVTYSVEPVGTAYAEGPKAVEENGTLSFKVAPQVGYVVSSVTVNGEAVEADEAGSGRTLSYTVAEVAQEQEVVILTTATGEHPEFSASIPVEDGTVIHIYAAEGILPAGVEAVAEVVPEIESVLKEKVEGEDGGQVASVLAYDINLMLDGTKLDNSWSDNGYVSVTFSGSRIKEETADGSSVDIYAVDDSNAEELNADTAASATVDTLTLESVGETLDVSGDSGVSNVSFEAEHFTIYAIIVGGENPAVATYNFYNGEGNLVNTQNVKNGETLVEPEIPSSTGNKFLGWSSNEALTSYQEFGPVEVTNTQIINLYARFDQVYYVFFYNQNDVIKQIKQANTGQSVPVNEVTIEVLSDEALTGWTLEKGSQISVGNNVTVTSQNINLYPIVKKVKWITYNANGGSYTSPAYVSAGNVTVKPADPERPGYTFDGWYKNPQLTTPFTFGLVLNEDTSLYAKWKPSNNTSYTVIHWKQNADDNGYSFAENQSLTGKTENQTNASAKTYDGFTAQTITQKTIAGDGSTIVDVYYNRVVYDIRFYRYSSSFRGGEWNEITGLRITARFGANIKSQWPNSTTYPIWGTTKNGRNAGSPYQSGIDVMPKDGDQFYFYESSGKYTYNMNYYLEVLTGESGISGYNNRQYRLDHTDTFKSDSSGWVTTVEDRYAIKGFTYSLNINDNRSFESQGNNRYKLDFYYYRNSYDIKFMNNGSLVNSISKQYEANISDVNYTPPRPAGVPSDYYFAGWYDNASLVGTAYSFAGKIMPAMNITLYAKWAAPQFEVTFNLNDGTGTGDYSTQIVNYGNKALQPDNPTKPGYTFAGWLSDENLFSFNTQIYGNINLVARWISTHTLSVVYHAGEGSGTVPTDDNAYVDGSRAVVKPGTGLTHSGNKVFIGWQLGDRVYYPGETFVVDSELAINDQVTLVAQWAALPEMAFLTYHANFDDDETSTVTVANNDTIEIADGDIFTREGYLFDRWTTEQNGGGDSYLPGDSALLDNIEQNQQNHLYAQWINQGLSVSAENVIKVYDGNGYGVNPVSNPSGSTILYKDDHGDYTLTASPTRKDVGTTTVYFKASKPGYLDAYGSAEVTISKKGVTITAADSSKVYGEADPDFADAAISGQIGTELNGIDLKVTRSDKEDNTLGLHPGVLGIGQTEADLNAAHPNYSFTVVPGNFTINKNAEGLNVSANNVSKVYDGNSYGINPESSLSGATITYSLTEEGSYTLQTSPTRRDVGTTTVYFKASLYGYEDAYGSATVTISKKGVTITAADSSKLYGEADPDFANATMIGQVGIELNGIDLKVTRSDKEDDTLGLHPAVLSIVPTQEALNLVYPNYSFTVVPGNFRIDTNEAGLKVNADDVSKVYDGNSYGINPESSLSGATITYSLTEEGDYTLQTSPTRKDVGTTTIYFKASLYGYKDAYGSATVTISKKGVTITAADSSKVYGEADPDFVNATMIGQIGTELNGIDLKVTRSDKEDDTLGLHSAVLGIGQTEADLNAAHPNYSFTVEPGNFTINKNEESLKVNADDVSKVYDGNSYGVNPESSLSGATIRYSLTEDGDYTLTASPTRKDVGTTTVYFKASLYGYEDAYGSADVTISKKDVTITAADSSKVYGEADPDFANATMIGQVGIELNGIDLKVTRSDKEDNTLGLHPDVLSIVPTQEALNLVYPNYSFTVEPGNFTINKNEEGLKVNADDVSKVYDGNGYGVNPESSLSGATIRYSLTEDGDYTLTASPTRKDVGTTTVYFKASLYGYEDAYGSADVTISKKGVTITAADSSKLYGEADPDFANATMIGQIGIELNGIDLKVTRSDKEDNTLGLHSDVLGIEQTEADLNAAHPNYSFTVVPGNFTINKNEESLKVNADDVSKVYDGNSYGVNPESSLSGATITYSLTEEGDYTLQTSPTRKDVGTTTIYFKASLYGYADAYGNATVTIDPKTVVIDVHSKFKNYGQSDSDLTFTGTIGGLVDEGDLGTVTYGRIPEHIGRENAGAEIVLTAFYEPNENYVVEITTGNLTIVASNANAVVITDRQVTYDGTAYGLTSVEAVREGSTLQYSTDNQQFTDEAPTFTEAGVHVVYVKVTNPNYETVIGQGTVTINKRNITVTAGSASKTYNGTPLTNNSATITSGSIADGQTWSINVTGSQTAVGTSKNVASGAVINHGELDVTANYNISYISGDLTVTSGGGTGGGGGGGGGSSPNPGTPFVPGGPGALVTIDPGQIPLANLPEENAADQLVLIEDDQIPLAGLPKTGDRNVMPNLATIISGVLLAAYAMITGKKKEEN